MARFLIGDELGNVKSLRWSPGIQEDTRAELKVLLDGTANANVKSVQALAISSSSNLLAAAFSDGSVLASSFNNDDSDTLKVIHEWSDRRSTFNTERKYLKIAVSERGIYSCSADGRLNLMSLPDNNLAPAHHAVSIPTRLYDWRLSANEETFAYGGHEVELSVWNTQNAFTMNASIGSGQKTVALFPAEIWRAKNVANDSLGLRQPVRITSLTYLSSSSSASHQHLLTGTQYGDIRRYDIRAARRPVAHWNGLGKVGGISVVEKGLAEHEVFIADRGGYCSVLDLRNGRIAYSYKGISGAVTSIAASPGILVSTSLDRFARIHSTYPLPPKAGQQQERKGDVLEKVFVKSLPTVVIWDRDNVTSMDVNIDSADDVWETMQTVEC